MGNKENIDFCSLLPHCLLLGLMCHQHTSSTGNSLHLTFFFLLLMNKILKRGICFQKRGAKNYCVDTWLVSLPPTPALSDYTTDAFEMLMEFFVLFFFLNVLL